MNYCTIDYDFPVIDPLYFMENYQLAKVVVTNGPYFPEQEGREEFEIGRIEILNNATLHKTGVSFMVPWEKRSYDSQGLWTEQKISSCYTWHVRLQHSITDTYWKIDSDLEGYKADFKYTSYYWLDSFKRIKSLNRTLYKDLYCEHESKQIYYADTSHIPSKIYFERKSAKGIIKCRGIEYFHKSTQGLDSIRVDIVDLDPNYLGHEHNGMYTYHFSANGLVNYGRSKWAEKRYKYYR